MRYEIILPKDYDPTNNKLHQGLRGKKRILRGVQAMEQLILFGIIFFGGLFCMGVLGAVVEFLTRCKWIDRLITAMISKI